MVCLPVDDDSPPASPPPDPRIALLTAVPNDAGHPDFAVTTLRFRDPESCMLCRLGVCRQRVTIGEDGSLIIRHGMAVH